MAKKNIHNIGLTLAITTTALSIICLILLLIFPTITLWLFETTIHGLDLSSLITNINLGWTTLVGLIVTFVASYLFGVIFTYIYNKLN